MTHEEFFQHIAEEGFVDQGYGIFISQNCAEFFIRVFNEKGLPLREGQEVESIEVWGGLSLIWDGEIEDMFSPYEDDDNEANNEKEYVDFAEILDEF